MRAVTPEALDSLRSAFVNAHNLSRLGPLLVPIVIRQIHDGLIALGESPESLHLLALLAGSMTDAAQ